MCVIVMQPAGHTLSNTRFNRCWDRNKDGGGFAYPGGEGNVIVSKGYFDSKQMRKAYRSAVKANPDQPFLLHFRIATSGLTDAENTHPFYINEGLVMAHNGHITGWGNKVLSDTRQFVLKVLMNLPDAFHRDPAMAELVRGYIGSDKMVLLDASGKWEILNESFGIWDEELWFSNTSYKKFKPYKKGGYGTAKSFKWYPKNEEEEKEDAITVEFIGLPCELCTTPLTRDDDDFCLDTAALYPVCLDCLDHFGIDQLITDGLIQWYDEQYDWLTQAEDAATKQYYEPEDMIPIEETIQT